MLALGLTMDKVYSVYNGKIKMKTKQYVVAYWPQNETYEDAEDFIMSIYELAADLILDDLTTDRINYISLYRF